MFADSAILVTGGTGSFGKALIRRLLSLDAPPRRIVVFSRDELKQLRNELPGAFSNNGSLRYFLGDVRDRDRSLGTRRDRPRRSRRRTRSRCRRVQPI